MNRHKNRNILLSIRERPLPTLWLLVCLLPYLAFSVVSVPHFHAAELPCSAVQVGSESTSGDHTHQQQVASGDHADALNHSALNCSLCQWLSGANGDVAIAALPSGARSSLSSFPTSESSASSLATLTLRVRGPPSLA